MQVKMCDACVITCCVPTMIGVFVENVDLHGRIRRVAGRNVDVDVEWLESHQGALMSVFVLSSFHSFNSSSIFALISSGFVSEE